MSDDDQTAAGDVSDVVEDVIDFGEGIPSSETLLAELKERCEKANIEVRHREYPGDEGVTYTSIALPSGREKRWVGASGSRLQRVLNVEFEHLVFLKGFEAICSYRHGFIEVGIRGVPVSHMYSMRRLMSATGKPSDSGEFVLEPPEGSENKPTYRIAPSSDEFLALSQLPGNFRRPSLRLEGLSISTNEQAVTLLLKYANSFLFQLDMLFGVSFMLERERVRRFRPVARNKETNVAYPVVEYDDAPLSLYWYARSARGLPLLQFLAFYQCVEFYFPTFSQAEARRKIGLLLKDPSFRADKESDVARLLSAISVSRSGGVGDERSQLRATIRECISPEDMRFYFSKDEEVSSFFRGKQKHGIHRIPVANDNIDLRDDVADRIYNIRFRIVHTKDGDQYGEHMILPFSDEADILEFDIDLVQFVARKVLIASSSILS